MIENWKIKIHSWAERHQIEIFITSAVILALGVGAFISFRTDVGKQK